MKARHQAPGQPIQSVASIKTQFDPGKPFADQAQAIVDSVGLSPYEWQTAPVLLNPPSLSIIACVLLAELHGRMGYFPPVLRLRPMAVLRRQQTVSLPGCWAAHQKFRCIWTGSATGWRPMRSQPMAALPARWTALLTVC